MFGLSVPWTIASAVIVAGVWSVIVFDYGNRNGSNARLLAAAQADLDRTNARLKVYRAQDEAEMKLQAALQDQAYDEASAALLKLGLNCPATQQAAEILNRIR